MIRLTTDTPNGNFETTLNFVYGKDGWAHIRYDGEQEDVKLTDWAKRQCLLRGCDEVTEDGPDDIDQRLCDCMMEGPTCPIAMAYCFASQAVHLRSRLKMYEDTMSLDRVQEFIKAEKDGQIAILPPNDPLTLEQLKVIDREPVWCGPYEWQICYGVSDFRGYPCLELGGGAAISLVGYGESWKAYRRKPKEG